MSWTVLRPLANSTARPLVSAQVRQLKDGSSKIHIFFSGTTFGEMANPARAEVMEGADEFHGCVRVEFGAEGSFKFSKSVAGGARVQIPLVKGAPNGNTGSHQCKIVEQDAQQITLRLPLADWEGERRPTRPGPPSSVPTPAARQAHASAPLRDPNDGRLDPIVYLKTKGHQIEARTGGRFQIDGEIYTGERVLQRINAHRKAAELPPLCIADLKLTG